jgi:excisionase family DNA binding protein
MSAEKFISTTDLAEILGISRSAVHKKIKNGEIEVVRVGRSYLVPRSSIPGLSTRITKRQREIISKAVHRTAVEYGEVLERLGRE